MAPHHHAGSFRPTVAEVVAAVRSLYADELKPVDRSIAKRLRERAAAAAGSVDIHSVPKVDRKYLRKVCEGCTSFALEPAEGCEYAVTFRGLSGTFMDTNSPVDPYTGRLWAEAAAYFEALDGKDCQLPFGHYACARVLVARGLPFLKGCSLGEVCHIVQLAISQKKLLGFFDGHMVPYGRSEECAR